MYNLDTPQIEVELYGGTLRQIFMLGATNFQYKKSIDRSYTGLKIDLRWVAIISFAQLVTTVCASH